MKSVLLSIQPKWCELIASGKKTVEVRKTKPKLKIPFKCYIYCTKNYYKSGDGYFQGKYCGKVIGEFLLDTIITDRTFGHDALFNGAACISEVEAVVYSLGLPMYGWHISHLVIYDKPKELSEFFVYCERCDKRPIACEYSFEESNESGYYSECMCDFKRPVKRPPQSWCYVEELEG